MTVAIVLFTRDLRVHDNPTLHAAVTTAERVIPLFVLDDGIAAAGYVTPNRAAFLAESLRDLDSRLRERGSRLVVRRGHVVEEVAKLATEHGAADVHVSTDFSAYAQRRQTALATALRAVGTRLHLHDDTIVVVPPGAAPEDADHFTEFATYHRRWAAVPRRTPLPAPGRLAVPPVPAAVLPTADQIRAGERAPQLPHGGELAARKLLRYWHGGVGRYATSHDDLAEDATSRLSPHLHFGTISPTELVYAAGTGPSAHAFTRRLAWRDFNHQVLHARPDAAWRDYRRRDVSWRDAPEDLAAWQAGRTGFPIVDAGIRQLLREGWMHNRARLIVASFLTKTMAIDWRLGARFFLDRLVDGDVANNQLNWQWMAGSGTDTRPYRTLNPLRQAERHDPDGAYVRRYIPDLARIDGGAVHQPWRLPSALRAELGYPVSLAEPWASRARFTESRAVPTSETPF